MTRTNRSLWSLLALAAFALAGLLLGLVSPGASANAPAAAVPAAQQPLHGDEARAPAPAFAALALPAVPPDDEAPAEAETFVDADSIAGGVDKVRRTRQLYAEYAVYPPHSRPLDQSNIDIVEWNRLRPEAQPFHRDDLGRELHAQLVLDRMFAGVDQPLTASVEVYRLSGEQRIHVPSQVRGELHRLDPETGVFAVVGEIAFEQVGEGRHQARFVPTSFAALRDNPGEVRLMAYTTSHGHTIHLRIPFVFEATRAFQVTGLAGDSVENGSLQVDLEVDVRTPGPVRIRCGLFDGSGERPIAYYDRWHRFDAPGRQKARIEFFGKILHDQGIDGPYQLKGLHGLADVTVQGEEFSQYWSYEGAPLVTGAHSHAAFSPAEWSSEEKREKLALYDEMAGDLELGE